MLPEVLRYDNDNTIVGLVDGAEVDRFMLEAFATSVGDGAFEGVVGVEELYLPRVATSIGENAFKDCTGLKVLSLTGLEPTATIGENAFEGCSGLKYLEITNWTTT